MATTVKAPTPQTSSTPPNMMRLFIDLPGEDARCWRPPHIDTIEVVLRKHRDVVFHVTQKVGASYTVISSESPFYNTHTKKYTPPKMPVTFKDGNRLHLWVSRSFKGTLTLYADGKQVIQVEPVKLDTHQCGPDPAEKPAPLIVAIGGMAQARAALSASEAELGRAPTFAESLQLRKQARTPEIATAKIERQPEQKPGVGEEQSMHVVEVKKDLGKMPEDVANFFKQGGEQTAIDSSGITSRNWLWAQIVGATTYVNDNLPWIKDLWKRKFYLQRVTHKTGEKVYIVFQGHPGLRKVLTAARYGADNAKVIAITAGAGTAAGLRHAAWEATKGAVKKGGLLALVFTIVLDTAEWLADYEQRDPKTGKPKKDVFDLCFKIGIDVAKAGISAAIGSLLVGGAIMLAGALIGSAVALPVIAIVIGTVIASIGVGYAIDFLDKETGATEKVNKWLRENAEYLRNQIPADYSGYDSSIETALKFGLGA